MKTAPADGVLAIGTLLELMRRASIVASQPELEFLVVNETRQLFSYRQAILWSTFAGKGRIQAISGQPRHDPDAPFIRWLTRLFLENMGNACQKGPQHLSQGGVSPGLAEEWPDWLTAYAVLLPVGRTDGRCLGGVLMVRETPWSREEMVLLGDLMAVYGLAWHRVLYPRQPWRHGLASWVHRGRWFLLALVLILVLAIPVRQSVLAPAEMVAEAPVIIRSPMKGVIDRFLVTPNQEVRFGDPLLVLDDKELKNRLEVARREYDLAVAELRQAEQKAVHGDENTHFASLWSLKVKQRVADVQFLQEKLQAVMITAPRDGVVIFSNPEDWLGRPVSQGERLFMLADPARVELSLQLAVTDAIQLEPGADVLMFLNGRPTDPLKATLRYASYQAEVTPDGLLAYQLKARLNQSTPVARIGLRGSARIYHGRVTLGGYLGRKPWVLVRQWLGI